MEQPPRPPKQVRVTPEQGDKEWLEWQKRNKEKHAKITQTETVAPPAETEPPEAEMEQMENELPTLRPTVIQKILEEGEDFLNLMTRDEKQNLLRYLEAFSESNRPDASVANTLKQYIDLEVPVVMPAKQKQDLIKLLGM